ncbi:hypothetical protein K7432_006814 [Basidiobolus ranarum]|uniref:Uncharacterized protein n=1 Tax=Basidiobolus ranarum TaxID=34480 RepID=A0ABR2WUA1_9FUNG
MISLQAKNYSSKSQCSDRRPSATSFFGNATFYQQELPIDLPELPKLSNSTSSLKQPLSLEEFGELNHDEAIDTLYDLLNDTFEKFVDFTKTKSQAC